MMRYRRKPRKCPKCSTAKIATIFWGMPNFAKIEKDLGAGKIVLGCCRVSDNNPTWQCIECGAELYSALARGTFECKPNLYGIVEFSSPLFCSADALGKSVNIVVGGHRGRLMLPSLPDWIEGEKDPLRKSLLGPMPARSWKRGDSLIYWGRPQSYPKGEASVELALMEFRVTQDKLEEGAQQVYEGFAAWHDLFEKYVVLLTKQGTHNNVEIHSEQKGLELLSVENDKLKHVSDNRSHLISIIMSKDDVSLHYNQLAEASFYSSSLFEPRFEYRLLLEAFNARRDGDYRKAIIEAANALEICLTARIMDEFERQSISFGEKLLQKYRMLGGRFELIKLLGITLPNKDYETLINKPRNDVVHKGFYPDRKLSYQVISEVEELLGLFSPKYHQDIPFEG